MFLYTGTAPRTYQDYVDEATGKMLTAEPGRQHEIRATWDRLPVPPADGFWTDAPPPPAPKAAKGSAKTSGDESPPPTAA